MTFFIAIIFSKMLLAAPIRAKAVLEAKSGSNVKGIVYFTQIKRGVVAEFVIAGLHANSRHGFHVHELGDCSSGDGKSAGPHYMKIAEGNGTSLDNPDHFAGDLPEIRADRTGRAKGRASGIDLSLGKEHSIIGRAIIIHDGPDDIHAKSSKRIACGAIKQEK